MSTPPKLGCLKDDSPSAKLFKSFHPYVPTSLETADPNWKPTHSCSMPPNMFSVGLQGNSDCVAWAVCKAMKALVFKKYHVVIDLSIRTAYYLARLLRGLETLDIGCYPNDMIYAAEKLGIPLEKYAPYDPSKVLERPPEEAFSTLERVYVTAPRDIYPLTGTLKPLHERTFVCSRISIFEKFYYEGPDKNGMLPMWTEGERVMGYHYIPYIGFDLTKKANESQFFWGEGYGKNGRIFVPWEFVENDGVSGDDWCLQDVRANFLES